MRNKTGPVHRDQYEEAFGRMRRAEARVAALERERDALAAQLAVAAGALGEVDDLIAKSKPLSGYLAAARTEIALALASLPERAKVYREEIIAEERAACAEEAYDEGRSYGLTGGNPEASACFRVAARIEARGKTEGGDA